MLLAVMVKGNMIEKREGEWARGRDMEFEGEGGDMRRGRGGDEMRDWEGEWEGGYKKKGEQKEEGVGEGERESDILGFSHIFKTRVSEEIGGGGQRKSHFRQFQKQF